MAILIWISMALATFRLSEMLVSERGPFAIMEKARYLAGVFRVDPDLMDANELNAIMDESGATDLDMPSEWAYNEVGKLFLCVWCMSVWVGLFYTILFAVHPEVALYASMPFSLSAVAVIAKERLNG